MARDSIVFPSESLFSSSERYSTHAAGGGDSSYAGLHKTAGNRWERLSLELWQAVAQGMDAPFEFREFSSLEAVLDALGKKEIDVIPAISVQDRYEAVMDFSQSYLKSGLSIALPAEGVHYRWFKVIENLFSPHILKAIGLLLFMSLIIGTIIWLFERQRNSEIQRQAAAGAALAAIQAEEEKKAKENPEK